MASYLANSYAEMALPRLGIFATPPMPDKAENFESVVATKQGRHHATNTMIEQSPEHAGRTNLTSGHAATQTCSPPTSPAFVAGSHDDKLRNRPVMHDRPLFPRDRHAQDANEEPLFRHEQLRRASTQSSDEIITHHEEKRRDSAQSASPTREEYDLAAEFALRMATPVTFKCVDAYRADPKRYIQKQFDDLAAYPVRVPQSAAGKKRGRDHVENTEESEQPAKKARTRRPASTAEKLPMSKPQKTRAAPRKAPFSKPAVRTSLATTPDNSRTKNSPEEKKTVPDELYDTIENHSPDPHRLNEPDIARRFINASKHLTTQKLVDGMPFAEKLHPVERIAASWLHLSPNRYLLCKRKILLAAFDLGEPLNKTKAQKACSIDVNKSSRLHSAFELAGWFDTVLEESRQSRVRQS